MDTKKECVNSVKSAELKMKITKDKRRLRLNSDGRNQQKG